MEEQQEAAPAAAPEATPAPAATPQTPIERALAKMAAIEARQAGGQPEEQAAAPAEAEPAAAEPESMTAADRVLSGMPAEKKPEAALDPSKESDAQAIARLVELEQRARQDTAQHTEAKAALEQERARLAKLTAAQSKLESGDPLGALVAIGQDIGFRACAGSACRNGKFAWRHRRLASFERASLCLPFGEPAIEDRHSSETIEPEDEPRARSACP